MNCITRNVTLGTMIAIFLSACASSQVAPLPEKTQAPVINAPETQPSAVDSEIRSIESPDHMHKVFMKDATVSPDQVKNVFVVSRMDGSQQQMIDASTQPPMNDESGQKICSGIVQDPQWTDASHFQYSYTRDRCPDGNQIAEELRIVVATYSVDIASGQTTKVSTK